jgi:hypothetical protein
VKYAESPIAFEDCNFYHVVDVPGIGTTSGCWDLRETIDAYLGNISFQDQRVLEIGPERISYFRDGKTRRVTSGH